MARRWRIRHKLMLGLATATAILLLLVAGTLKGLWSYYLTMKSIESKLAELTAAQTLKNAVSALTLRGDITDPGKVAAKLKDDVRQVRDDLTKYENAFKATVERDLPFDDGKYIPTLLPALLESVEKLEREANVQLEGDSAPRGTADILDQFRQRVGPSIEKLWRASDDLHSSIQEDLTRRIKESRRHYQVTVAILIGTVVLGVILTVSAVRFFYGWIFNPVRELQGHVGRVAHGDFDHRIEVRSGDEMEELASAFNDMTQRLSELYRDMARQINERSRQLVRSERLASVGFLAAGVAHEINNPLASIAFCSEALEARLAEMQESLRVNGRGMRDFEVFSKYLKMIQEEAFRCKNITERLLEFSRNGERRRERTDLARLIESVLEVTRLMQQSRDREIVFHAQSAVEAWVGPEEIKQVVLNLVINGLESMDEGGRLTVELRAREGMAELVFADTGCGMTAEVLENIFEPFFTRNRSGKGTGLGLTITHRIVSQHGGEIEAASPGADRGSTFTVRLPLSPADAGKEERSGHAAA